MSDQRRLIAFGRKVTTPSGDFWQVSTTEQDPEIPNLPLEDPVGGGGSPQTLTALVCTILLTVPTVIVSTAVTRPAGQQTIAVSAPTATALATVTRTAGQLQVSVSAPAAAVSTTVTRPAGQQAINVSAPAATLLAAIALPGGGQTINVSAPSATVLTTGGGARSYFWID